MKLTKARFLTLVAVLTFVGVIPASAGTITWSQLWSADTRPVDKIELFMITPSVEFGAPALSGLPDGWSTDQPNPQYVFASGPLVNLSNNYNINFSSPTDLPLTIDVLEWNGITLSEQVRFYYKQMLSTDTYQGASGDWQWKTPVGVQDSALAGTQYDRNTPEPATMSLIGGAMIALVAGRRKLTQLCI